MMREEKVGRGAWALGDFRGSKAWQDWGEFSQGKQRKPPDGERSKRVGGGCGQGVCVCVG